MKQPRYKIDFEFTIDNLISLDWILDGIHKMPPSDAPVKVKKAIHAVTERAYKQYRAWRLDNFNCERTGK